MSEDGGTGSGPIFTGGEPEGVEERRKQLPHLPRAPYRFGGAAQVEEDDAAENMDWMLGPQVASQSPETTVESPSIPSTHPGIGSDDTAYGAWTQNDDLAYGGHLHSDTDQEFAASNSYDPSEDSDTVAALSAVPATVKANVLAFFSPELLGPSLILSSDHLSVRLDDPTGLAGHGVVFGDAPLEEFQGEQYFEVRVDDVTLDQKDGLVIGVMLAKPTTVLQDPPDFADELPDSWSLGYDGMCNKCQSPSPIPWRPRDLQIGDRVGLLVSCYGCISVFQNDIEMARGFDRVPVGVPLYGFINLLGNTTGVTVLAGAQPPEHEEDFGPPTHTLSREDAPEQWDKENDAIKKRDVKALAALRAERCLETLSWTCAKSGTLALVPFGSLGSASVVYLEMDEILAKFGMPMRVQDTTMGTSSNPSINRIRSSVSSLGAAGAAVVAGSLSTNALYAIPVVGFAAATVAGPAICGSGAYSALTTFVDDLQPIAEEFYMVQFEFENGLNESLDEDPERDETEDEGESGNETDTYMQV